LGACFDIVDTELCDPDSLIILSPRAKAYSLTISSLSISAYTFLLLATAVLFWPYLFPSIYTNSLVSITALLASLSGILSISALHSATAFAHESSVPDNSPYTSQHFKLYPALYLAPLTSLASLLSLSFSTT
jgi:hypothetical protein